jgi:hypothetical protein
MRHLGTAEMPAEHIQRERLREADQERLARLAERLHALAARIDVPAQLDSKPATS